MGASDSSVGFLKQFFMVVLCSSKVLGLILGFLGPVLVFLCSFPHRPKDGVSE